jgi:Na+/proline symporter
MFTALDWSIIVIYLLFAFAIGLLMTRKASQGLSSYFIAERSLPWWWLGTSMAATTFASDTPLAVTGIVAKAGIAGNWFLWCSILTYITMTVFFARKWRKSQVLTDVEITELRYGGSSASILRAFKAFYFSIIINSFVLGWAGYLEP